MDGYRRSQSTQPLPGIQDEILDVDGLGALVRPAPSDVSFAAPHIYCSITNASCLKIQFNHFYNNIRRRI